MVSIQERFQIRCELQWHACNIYLPQPNVPCKACDPLSMTWQPETLAGLQLGFQRNGTSRFNLGQDVSQSICHRQKYFLVPLSLCPWTRAGAKNPGTNSFVMGNPGKKLIFPEKKDESKNFGVYSAVLFYKEINYFIRIGPPQFSALHNGQSYVRKLKSEYVMFLFYIYALCSFK